MAPVLLLVGSSDPDDLGGLTPHNTSRTYSPVTLSSEWSPVGKLFFVAAFASLGSIINGFFVSSFFVEYSLRKLGNTFLACVGLADMIITGVIMPISAVVLLSGEWDNLGVCRVLQFFGQTSTYAYSMFFAMVAMENYYRVCRTPDQYEEFISMNNGCTSVFIFTLSFCLSAVGVFFKLDYDYCLRKNHGDFKFRIATLIIFHAVPLVLTYIGLLVCSMHIRHRVAKEANYKRSYQYERDNSITHLELAVFTLNVLAWVPYLVMVFDLPNADDAKFYHCAWLGIGRAIFTNFLYCALNRNFRRAFTHLFYYCCCKSSLYASYSTRHQRRVICECKIPVSDIRVHIMHQAVYNISPLRGASTSREIEEL